MTNMDFGSIRRKNRAFQPSRRKAFSSSNLSCISCASASVSRKTVVVTLPKDFGCEVSLDGKVVRLRKGGPAHAVGVIQLGDYLRIVEGKEDPNVVKLQVTYGKLEVEMRPSCPLVIEIGNRSHTSLGLALTDTADNKIQISNIQPGSLADRCGFLFRGDILTSIYPSEDSPLLCSPFYNSYQIAQMLRQITSSSAAMKMTIVPLPSSNSGHRPNSVEDVEVHSGGSDSTLTLGESDSSSNSSNSNNLLLPPRLSSCSSTFTGRKSSSSIASPSFQMRRQIEKVSEIEEETESEREASSCVLSLCLWKDPLYEDWGFSLVDEGEVTDIEGDASLQFDNTETGNRKAKRSSTSGSLVYEIRPGGPAYVAGLRSNDRIIEINGRDVSRLESTMLVPVLASLENALTLLVLREKYL